MQTRAILPSIQDILRKGRVHTNVFQLGEWGSGPWLMHSSHSLKSASKRENCHSCSPISLAQQQIPTGLKSSWTSSKHGVTKRPFHGEETECQPSFQPRIPILPPNNTYLCVCVGGGLRVCVCVCVLVSHIHLFFDSIDCSPPGSSVHGILQARILE